MTNPFSKMLVDFSPETFFGRQKDLILLLQGICAQLPRSFVLHGLRSIGKTSLLRCLYQTGGDVKGISPNSNEYSYEQNNLIYIYANFYNVTGKDAIEVLFSNLIRDITIQEYIGSIPPDTFLSKSAQKKYILDIMQLFIEKHFRLVICIDSFDKAYRELEPEDDEFLRGLTRDQAFIYVTEKSLPALRENTRKTSPLYNVLHPREIGLLGEEDALDLVLKPAAKIKLSFTQWDADFIIRKAGRHPYILTIVCEYLYNRYLETPEIQAELPGNTQLQDQIIFQVLETAAIQDLFSFYLSELNPKMVQVVEMIADSKPLTENFRKEIAILRNKGLVKPAQPRAADLPELFSELFRMFVIDKSKTILASANKLKLHSVDRKVLDYIQARPGQICTFEDILDNVWGDRNSKRSLEAAIQRLRRNLSETGENNQDFIENIRGAGYRYMSKKG